ncbi:MAG: hypothetical protein R3C18_27195 [Planctomycetaceae bacterium]
MTLSERLAENVRACFAGIWIQSFEHEDALWKSRGCATASKGRWQLGMSTWDCGYREVRTATPLIWRDPIRWPQSEH